ncbi:MAG: hypothetical protein B7Z69_09945 [Actinobacteria bacterium 21-73-9]|nr:MAG: hypothetical protein B7Z69_09945 [Actinobacteria bacterium 21-73-9]
MGPVRIVIVGGSFGGLTTAYELRRRLTPERAEITLLAKDDQFRFVPSFPWVATGRRRLEQISFPLAGPLARKQVPPRRSGASSPSRDRSSSARLRERAVSDQSTSSPSGSTTCCAAAGFVTRCR